jgi:hypothetical protein
MREGGPGRDPAPYLTIPGLSPIDAVRVVTPTLHSDSGECTGFTPLNNAIRATLIAQMLDEQPERMTIKSHVDVNIKAKDDQDYKTQLAAYVDRQEAMFRTVENEPGCKAVDLACGGQRRCRSTMPVAGY